MNVVDIVGIGMEWAAGYAIGKTFDVTFTFDNILLLSI